MFFKQGPKKGQSKGLKQIAIELGFEIPTKIKLVDLKAILIEHPAFSVTTKLEKLASTYGIRILFCPKYHCELNPIEGLWCDQKYFVRKQSNQNFNRMCELIKESRNDFIRKNLYVKLIKRFWRCLVGYKNNASYFDILKTYFSGRSKANIESHRKISNNNLNMIYSLN